MRLRLAEHGYPVVDMICEKGLPARSDLRRSVLKNYVKFGVRQRRDLLILALQQRPDLRLSITTLAAEIDRSRDFTRLPELGDLLVEADCSDDEVVRHCYGINIHEDPEPARRLSGLWHTRYGCDVGNFLKSLRKEGDRVSSSSGPERENPPSESGRKNIPIALNPASGILGDLNGAVAAMKKARTLQQIRDLVDAQRPNYDVLMPSGKDLFDIHQARAVLRVANRRRGRRTRAKP